MLKILTSNLKSTLSISLASLVMLAGCGSDSTSEIDKSTPFSLSFSAKSAGELITCDSEHNQFGTEALHSISVSDIRFYVSNIKFLNANNEVLDIELAENDFQLHSDQGFVGLIDLTSNSSGACNDEALGGTQRINTAISGTILDGDVASISFDVGVPQAVMKDVIATNTQEDAPTPLNEMFWSWASGYRHFLMNFQIENAAEISGKGLVHLGSTKCGGEGLLALENKETCDSVNTPKVTINNFDPTENTIVINVDALLNNVTFAATGDEVVPTVACHSNPMQTDCATIFENFGLNITDGNADADANLVFNKE